jgi:hypothetical protein
MVSTDADHIRDLAANIGIQFKPPEEFFLNENPKPFTREFDPASYVAQSVVSSKIPPKKHSTIFFH